MAEARAAVQQKQLDPRVVAAPLGPDVQGAGGGMVGALMVIRGIPIREYPRVLPGQGTKGMTTAGNQERPEEPIPLSDGAEQGRQSEVDPGNLFNRDGGGMEENLLKRSPDLAPIFQPGPAFLRRQRRQTTTAATRPPAAR